MADNFATNHERIWLQPLCCVDERCWCEHPQDCGDDGCDLPAIEYIRADLVPGHAEMVTALKNAEQIISTLIGMYGDSGAGIVLREVSAALSKAEGKSHG